MLTFAVTKILARHKTRSHALAYFWMTIINLVSIMGLQHPNTLNAWAAVAGWETVACDRRVFSGGRPVPGWCLQTSRLFLYSLAADERQRSPARNTALTLWPLSVCSNVCGAGLIVSVHSKTHTELLNIVAERVMQEHNQSSNFGENKRNHRKVID